MKTDNSSNALKRYNAHIDATVKLELAFLGRLGWYVSVALVAFVAALSTLALWPLAVALGGLTLIVSLAAVIDDQVKRHKIAAIRADALEDFKAALNFDTNKPGGQNHVVGTPEVLSADNSFSFNWDLLTMTREMDNSSLTKSRDSNELTRSRYSFR